jgi:hypothetical protein
VVRNRRPFYGGEDVNDFSLREKLAAKIIKFTFGARKN